MTIRPVDINGMIQRTQDVGTLKQQQDAKPMVDQQNIQTLVVREEERVATQVTETEEANQEDFRYDAKEKGNSQYEAKRKKKKAKKEESREEGRVIVKGQPEGIDIKI